MFRNILFRNIEAFTQTTKQTQQAKLSSEAPELGIIDVKVFAGKKFPKNGTKYYVAYDVVDEASDSFSSNYVFRRKFQKHNATESMYPDSKEMIMWKHGNRIEVAMNGRRDILKFECCPKKPRKKAIGEIIVPLDTLPSGIEKCKWVSLKENKIKQKQKIYLSLRYLDRYAREFMNCAIDPAREADALQLLQDHPDSIPSCLVINFKKKTILHEACDHDWSDLVLHLLKDPSADCNAQDKLGTPLMIACRQSNEKIVKEMLQRENIDIQLKDKSLQGLLHYACKGRSEEIVRILLARGLNHSAVSKTLKVPLHYAASHGSSEQVQLLLGAGAYVDPVTEVDDATPLTLAVKHGDYNSTALLLKMRANPNHNSYTPAVIAVNNGDHEILELLLQPEYHANMNRTHALACHTAINENYLDVLKILLPLKEKTLHKLYNDRSLVHSAVLSNNEEILAFLLDANADANIACSQWDGMENVTPLVMAVRLGRTSLVAILLTYSNPNIPCSWPLYEADNLTALHIAVLVEDIESLKLLMGHAEIDISLSTKTQSVNRFWRGLTPEDLAYRNGQSEFLTYLQGGFPDLTAPLLSPLAGKILQMRKSAINTMRTSNPVRIPDRETGPTVSRNIRNSAEKKMKKLNLKRIHHRNRSDDGNIPL